MYAWRTCPVSDRDWADAQLTNTIFDIHRMSCGSYGFPRVHAELLLGQGQRCGRKHRCYGRSPADGTADGPGPHLRHPSAPQPGLLKRNPEASPSQEKTTTPPRRDCAAGPAARPLEVPSPRRRRNRNARRRSRTGADDSPTNTKGGLQYLEEWVQRRVLRNDDPSPHRWLRLHDRRFQLVDVLTHLS